MSNKQSRGVQQPGTLSLRDSANSFFFFKTKSTYKINYFRSSSYGSVVTNPTSIHEDAGLTPGPAQWVRDPALP